MQYQGGKTRLAKYIVSAIVREEEARGWKRKKYIEPFVGMASVLCLMDGERAASDIDEDVIAFWKAVQHGFRPRLVTKEEWLMLKDSDEPSAQRCVAKFGYSFAGVHFLRFAGDYKRPPELSHRAITKRTNKAAPLVEGVEFKHGDYTMWSDEVGCTIYCDPPYAGTLKYEADFNHEHFWKWATEMSKDNLVFVSEIVAPDDWVPVFEKCHSYQCARVQYNKIRVEKVFVHKSNSTILQTEEDELRAI